MRAAVLRRCLWSHSHPLHRSSATLRRTVYITRTPFIGSYYRDHLSKYEFVHIKHRLLTTHVSTDEQTVIKGLENFLSIVEDEAITTKQKYHMYIQQLIRAGNLWDCLCLLKHLRDSEIHLNLNSYNLILEAASEAKNFSFFSYIFKSLLLSNIPPEVNSYKIVSKFLQQTVESELKEFVQEISEITGNKDPTVINRIIFFTANSGQLDKAILIYDELKTLQYKMDTVTFNTILAMLGKAGQVDRMLSEFSLMKDFGHTPDTITYNTLINCLRRLGKLELCKKYTREMIDAGIEMDLRTYTALIDAFGRAGQVQHALKIFDGLKKSAQVSIYIYRSLISTLKKAGNHEVALKLEEEMNSTASKLLGPMDFKRKKRGGRT